LQDARSACIFVFLRRIIKKLSMRGGALRRLGNLIEKEVVQEKTVIARIPQGRRGNLVNAGVPDSGQEAGQAEAV
jgi:hypothetical protein